MNQQHLPRTYLKTVCPSNAGDSDFVGIDTVYTVNLLTVNHLVDSVLNWPKLSVLLAFCI